MNRRSSDQGTVRRRRPTRPVASTAMLVQVLLVAVAVAACTSAADVPEATTQPDLDTTTTRPEQATTTSTTLGVDPAVVAAIESTLEKVTTEPAAAVARGILDDVDVTAALPAGSTIEMDPGTLLVSEGRAEVVVTVMQPSGQVDRFAVVLVPSREGWLIAYTVALP